MEAGIFDLDDRSVRSVENDSDDSSDTDNADRGDHRDAEADAVTDVEPPPHSNPPEGHKLFTHEYTSLDDIMEDRSTGRQSGLAPSIRRTPSQWEGVSLEIGGPRITATQSSQISSDITGGPSIRPSAKRTAATQSPRVARGGKRTRDTG